MIWRVKNPHLKVAIIIAPLLMVGGWVLAEIWWNYRHPDQATSKRPYTLCDLQLRDCMLVKDDARLSIHGTYTEDKRLTGIELSSNVTLAKVLFSIGKANEDVPPKRLESPDGRIWRSADGAVDFAPPDPGDLILRMVARSNKGEYIGEMKLRY